MELWDINVVCKMIFIHRMTNHLVHRVDGVNLVQKYVIVKIVLNVIKILDYVFVSLVSLEINVIKNAKKGNMDLIVRKHVLVYTVLVIIVPEHVNVNLVGEICCVINHVHQDFMVLIANTDVCVQMVLNVILLQVTVNVMKVGMDQHVTNLVLTVHTVKTVSRNATAQMFQV